MKFRSKIFGFASALLFGATHLLFANPTGMNVGSGSAVAQNIGSQLNVTVSQTAILNWNSFNIAAGETTTFLQPSANSVVFNEIGGRNPSQVFGNLNANGTVILANANGFYFGPNSMIKVGGSFIATTAGLPPDFGTGAAWQFTGMPPLAKVVNYGQIEVGQGRSLYLIAESIENHGELNAPGGDIGLYAGESVLVSDSPDGRGLSATVQVPSGSVNNFGQITADAGTIVLQAQVVNQNGIIQADSVQNQNGVIELVASDQLNLGADSQILARGDDSAGGSSGGNVTLKSGNNFSDTTGGEIVATGGANGGNGGSIEISAPDILSLNSSMDASAQDGWLGGYFLLDPASIVLGTTSNGSVPVSGTVAYNSAPSTLNLNVNANGSFKNFSQILLQATGNITLNQNVNWNLSSSTGIGSGQLMLEAGGNIVFQSGSKITDGNNWSVTLDAGVNNFTTGAVQSGGGTASGNIYLNGGSGKSQSGTIQLSTGSINLFAGTDIQVGSGSVYTKGGGGIFAYALGSIDVGSDTAGYSYFSDGSEKAPNPGGISTAAGGNVTLIAGQNITSDMMAPANGPYGASGAYGPNQESGNVTLIAGNQITGSQKNGNFAPAFTLANGVGTVIVGAQVNSAQAAQLQNPNSNPVAYAALLNNFEAAALQTQNPNANFGTASLPITLDLIKGSWNVWAANNIYLSEVLNPDGTFNQNSSFSFTYAPDAAVRLTAGNGIVLDGGISAPLERVQGFNNQSMAPIYAPILTLDAGEGGITLENSIYLFPSSDGALQITTSNGGNLTGAVQSDSTELVGITMFGSTLTDWNSIKNFLAGETSTDTLLHLNDPNPVTLDISGSIGSFGLDVPTYAQITVDGTQPYIVGTQDYFGTYNFGFSGRNLSASGTTSTTSINVTGDITYRGDLTTIDLSGAQLSDALPSSLFTDSADTAVTGKLSYDATTGKLTFVGVMSPSDLAFLLAPSVFVLDKNGNIVTKPLTLDATQQGIINELSAASQSASLGANGLALAGPGNFDITARNIDLGVSAGIYVGAPDAALAAVSPFGANINITTPGNLEMTSTSIHNQGYLGGINLNVGGSLDVGGQDTAFGNAGDPKGIYTESGGDVSVLVNGDVNVDSSRIAAYNGGNVTIESLNGNVNAGTGGNGFVNVDALEFDTKTGQLIIDPTTGEPAELFGGISGSGILATTLFGSHASLGNILVETPNGNISASKGGVLQISFDGTDASKATAYLLAGYELRDASAQNRLSAADISSDYDLRNNNNNSPYPADLIDGAGNIVGELVFVSQSRNIDASGSGVVAQNITAKATGEINGLFVSAGKTDITASDIGPVIVFSQGPINLTGPQDGPSPIIITSTDPVVNGIETPPIATDAPNVAKEVAQTADDVSTVVSKTDDQSDVGDDDKKKGKQIALAQKVGRVTVVLPPKNLSENQNSRNPL
jgi:filamentous hemagglutinin family protein